MSVEIVWSLTTPAGNNLANDLKSFYKSFANLQVTNSVLNNMTNQQIVDVFGVQAISDGTPQTALQQAATLKSEMAADIGRLATDNTGVLAALNQLRAMTGWAG